MVAKPIPYGSSHALVRKRKVDPLARSRIGYTELRKGSINLGTDCLVHLWELRLAPASRTGFPGRCIDRPRAMEFSRYLVEEPTEKVRARP